MAKSMPKASDVKWIKKSTGGFTKFEKKGDSVIGKFKQTKKQKGQFGIQHVHIIETAKGETRVAGAVLDNLFEDVKPSTMVKIVFTGMGGKGKNKYKNFDFFTEE